jgi:hypothetical protein
MKKSEDLERERDEERTEGITEDRRGSPAAPSDRPENAPAHPQDVNEIGEDR